MPRESVPQILVECPAHGRVPVISPFGGMPTIISSKMTCPVKGCNRMASIMDGTYDENRNYRLFDGSAIVPPRFIERLKAERTRIKAEETITDETIALLGGISPTLAIYFQEKKSARILSRENINTIVGIIGVIISALLLYLTFFSDRGSTAPDPRTLEGSLQQIVAADPESARHMPAIKREIAAAVSRLAAASEHSIAKEQIAPASERKAADLHLPAPAPDRAATSANPNRRQRRAQMARARHQKNFPKKT